MLFAIFYELLLFLAGIVYLPRFVTLRLFGGKYKRNFWQRLGFGFPKIEREDGPLVWVHAVSVGEMKSIVPLLRALHQRNPKLQFVVSSITETGYDEGKRSIDFPCTQLFMPFDLGFLARPLLKKLRPDVVLFSETDIWLRFMEVAKEYGAEIVLVSGKISEKSAQNFASYPIFTKRLFGLLDLLCVQNKTYAARYMSLGVPPKKIVITGNLKFDQSVNMMNDEQKRHLREKLNLKPDDFVIVVGSTHHEEEHLIINALYPLWSSNPKVKVILVPRHPERFNDVAKMLEKQNIAFKRFDDPNPNPGNVILVDRMGVLMDCYQIANLAIVCGSFIERIGGHNILEPLWYGVPVIFGPYMENQTEFAELVNNSQSGIQIQDMMLGFLVKTLLEDPQELKRMGEAGIKLTHDLKGAVDKTLHALPPVISKL